MRYLSNLFGNAMSTVLLHTDGLGEVLADSAGWHTGCYSEAHVRSTFHRRGKFGCMAWPFVLLTQLL